MLTRAGDLACVFIGYDEPDREAHWQDLREKMPRAVRIDGVKGFTSAFQAAAMAARTERFITVDADCRVDARFCEHPIADDLLNSNKVLSWPVRNVVNSLAYGNGGIKCWTRSMLKSCRRPDAEHLDHPYDFGFAFQTRLFGTSHPNGSRLQAFRSGFREGARLGLVKGTPPGLERLGRMLPENGLRRLVTWCSLGTDVHLGLWCIWGAREGCLKAQSGKLELALINDYDAFNAYFAREIEPRADRIDGILRRRGERLRAAGLDVADLGPQASAFFRAQLTGSIDVAAFDTLGNLYRSSPRDLPNDPEKACDAYFAGALLGSGNAMNNLARCYRDGAGVTRDPVQAQNWVLHAAALDNQWALLRLGRQALADGDPDRARYWLERAARAGSNDADAALADLAAIPREGAMPAEGPMPAEGT